MADSMEDSKTGKSVAECCLEMFEGEVATDVTFVVDNDKAQNSSGKSDDMNCDVPVVKKARGSPGEWGKRDLEMQDERRTGDNKEGSGMQIRAHKFILMARSPVFRAMFTGPLAKTSDVIRVSDCRDAEAFRQMLRYIYSEKTTMTSVTVMNVLYLAKKYMLPQLVAECLRYAKHCITPALALGILQEAVRHGQDDLVRVCMTVIGRETEQVLHSEEFYNVSRDILQLILSEDSLSVSEVDLCESCLEWARRKCYPCRGNAEPTNDMIREALGPCLYKIQFQNLDAKAFTRMVVQKGILPQDLAFQFYRYILSDDNEKGDVPEGFVNRRITETHGVLYPAGPLRKSQISENFSVLHKVENIKISTNKPMKIESLTFLILLHPSASAESELCHMTDDRDTIVIDGSACCQSIKYRVTPKDARDQTKFFKLNGQVIAFHVFPSVEVRGVCEMSLKLRSRIQVRFLPAEVDKLTDNGVSVTVKCEGSSHGLPLCEVGYTLCEE